MMVTPHLARRACAGNRQKGVRFLAREQRPAERNMPT
jgi:hypothetical protein